MFDFLATPSAQVVLYVAALLVMLVVAFYVVQRLRDFDDEDTVSASDLMTNFQEMHEEGDISGMEYRTIKTVLNDQLKDELKEREEQG